MIGFFLKQSAIYGLSSVLSRFATLITVPIYYRLMGAAEFGIFDLYVTAGALVFVFLELQIGSGFMREYYEFKKGNKQGRLLGSVLTFYMYSFLFALVCVLLIPPFLPEDSPVNFEYALPLILSMMPRLLIYIIGIILRLEHKAVQFLTLNLTHFFAVALFGVATVYWFDGNGADVLLAYFYAQCLSAGLGAWLLLKLIRISFCHQYTKRMLAYGVPIVPAVVGGWVIDASGRMIIADELGTTTLGDYTILVKVAMVMMLAVQVFRMVWDPIAIKVMSEPDGEGLFAKGLSYYFIAATSAIVLIMIGSPVLISIIGGELTRQAAITLVLLLTGYAWQGAVGIVSAGNAYQRKSFLNSAGSLSGGMTSILFTIAFINTAGIIAAGLGFTVGMLTSFLVTYFLAQSTHFIAYKKMHLLIAVGVTVALGFCCIMFGI